MEKLAPWRRGQRVYRNAERRRKREKFSKRISEKGDTDAARVIARSADLI
jgi:hypothetical protein